LVLLAGALLALSAFAMTDIASAQRPFRPNMYDRFGEMRRSRPRYGYTIQRAPVTRRFSVAPSEFKTGDTVKVTVDTPLKRGKEVLATVPAGATHKVIKVNGPWVGISLEQDGEKLRGWVDQRALDNG
jgi:hypothetical protein